MMESIEKLRKSLKDCTNEAGVEPNRFDTYWITARACDMLIDEIEAEIERDYMKLPVDAEGVPIHVGDSLECTEYGNQTERFTVHGYTTEYSTWTGEDTPLMATNENSTEFYCRNCRHVKPRTLEDVLRDVWKEALDYAKSDIWRNPDEVFAERADEIRELMEVGE